MEATMDNNDLEEGLRFVHVMGMQTKSDVLDATTEVYALAEELIARGVLDLRALEERRARVRERENQRQKSQVYVQVAPSVDKYALTDLPVIDCAARIPLCQARCCKLMFPLSFQDLDERIVKWDYARPYQIRRREDQYCTHSDETTRACQIYAHRPAVCRTYDCRNDKRIWIDFDKRIPAPEEALSGDATGTPKTTP